MRDEWLKDNDNNTEEMPDFEYYDFENYLLYHYYVYMTLFSQGKELEQFFSERNQLAMMEG